MNARQAAGTILFGGSGFLGSYVLASDPAIVSVGRTPPATPHRHVPIASLADLRALGDLEFDTAIFLVGHSDREAMDRERVAPGEPTAFDHQLVPLIQALEQLQHRPLRKFLTLSTILLYDPARVRPPVDEDAPIAPHRSRYVFSQHLAEEVCRFYGRRVPVLSVRISNVYGPTPRPRYDLINVLCRTLATEGRAHVRSRRPKRDFLHAADAARAILALARSDATGTINLCSGVMTPVGTIVDLLQEISGCPIVDRDLPVDGPMEFCCDTTRLSRYVDWRPEHTLESGLRDTYERTRAMAPSRR